MCKVILKPILSFFLYSTSVVFYGGFISSNQALDYVKIEFPSEKHTAKLEVNVKLSAQMDFGIYEQTAMEICVKK